MTEKFKHQLDIDKASDETQELTENLHNNYPNQKDNYTKEQYELEDELLDIERRKNNEARSEDIELTPEIIEKIMAKVQDINKKGVAYSGIARLYLPYEALKPSENQAALYEKAWQEELEHIKRILVGGLLGRSLNDISKGDEIRETYKKERRQQNKDIRVHFNIVGRAADLPKKEGTEISQCYWTKKGLIRGTISLLFDISPYKEVSTSEDNENEMKKIFENGDPSPNAEGKPRSEFGFVLYPSIPPNLFQGLVLDPENFELSDGKAITDLANLLTKIYGRNLEFLIPIYNTNGDLLWPQQMNYKEIKKYIDKN